MLSSHTFHDGSPRQARCWWRSVLTGGALLALAGAASAQRQPAQAPPPGGQQPAPAQGQPPHGYPPVGASPYPYPPSAYPQPGYPPPGYGQQGYYPYYPPEEAPKTLHYEEGQPIPPGYYLDEGPIKGLIISGAIVLGIPYVLGLSIASGADFDNQSGWLAVPVMGPWITLGAREHDCTVDPGDETCDVDNAAMRTLYVLDGLIQATGGALLIAGLLSSRKRLVRQDVSQITVTPVKIGTGYGLGAFGTF